MSKKPEESAFVETSEQGSLRRIAEAVRGRKQARSNMIAAKLSYREAKAEYERACDEEQAVSDAETTELPLFPRSRENGDAPSAKEAKPASPAANPGLVFLSSLDGFPASAAVKLGVIGIQTLEDLDAFQAEGKKLDEIEDIGAGLAHRVRAAVNRYRDARKES